MPGPSPHGKGLAARIQAALRPIAAVAIVLALVSGPVLSIWVWLAPDPDAVFVPVYLIWLFLTVGFGLLGYYVLHHIAALSVVAYIVAGIAGMFLIFGLGLAKDEDAASERNALVVALVAYVLAAVLYALHRSRRAAQIATMRDGVTTNATVQRAGVGGMINYVQLWHLTLKFTDQQGTTRYFRTRLLGAGGFAPGDTIPIRYNPAHPGSTWGIVVDPESAPDSFRVNR